MAGEYQPVCQKMRIKSAFKNAQNIQMPVRRFTVYSPTIVRYCVSIFVLTPEYVHAVRMG